MRQRSDGFPARQLATALVLVCLGAIAMAATTSQVTGIVGDETCATCHDSQAKGLHQTLHGKAQNGKTPAAKAGQACETCHGPGQKHVDSGKKDDIVRFATLKARDANDACLSCHARTAAHAAGWQGSLHDARNVSCVSCHSMHSPKSAKAQLKTASAVDTCVSCHKQEAMKVQKSGHMPLREGKMDCTSCHSPHGSTNVRMLKTGNTVNESCASCHAEKRGPFMWEHSAGRENCASCHDPHGSNNDRMLVAKAPMLCQRCHVASRHPATIYDGTQLANASNRMVGRSCVNCHSQIHGSNHPSGNFFLR
jgi:DmsE family decaheme c-type cytochrome